MRKGLIIGLAFLLVGGIVVLIRPTNPASPSIPVQAASGQPFHTPEPIVISGYEGSAMEPAISKDGKYLLWNDTPPNKDIHWATAIDASHFSYQGKVEGINLSPVDASPDFDISGNLYYTSLVNYIANKETLFVGRFVSGSVVNSRPLAGNIYVNEAQWVSIDPDVSPTGEMLYYTEGLFSSDALPQNLNIRAARKLNSTYTLDNSITVNINTEDLEYAPTISADGKELFFTRINLSNGAPIDNGIYVARRNSDSEPFGTPEKVEAITGNFVEAPTISLDGRNLYYHQEEEGKYVLYRVQR